jgi:hypothetical protein
MTAYELTDLMFSATNGATAVNGLIFTIISGYLIVAWTIGEKLTRSQVTMVNLLFLSSAPMMEWGWLGRYLVALDLQNRLIELEPQTAERVSMYVISGHPFVTSILIIASMKFMWDIRHPKTK